MFSSMLMEFMIQTTPLVRWRRLVLKLLRDVKEDFPGDLVEQARARFVEVFEYNGVAIQQLSKRIMEFKDADPREGVSHLLEFCQGESHAEADLERVRRAMEVIPDSRVADIFDRMVSIARLGRAQV